MAGWVRLEEYAGCYIRVMNDFNDLNGQRPYGTGNADVPRSPQDSPSSQGDQNPQVPIPQQYAQNQQYAQPYAQSARPQYAQESRYGQAQAQYGQPQYGRTQYGQTPQYGQAQPQPGYFQQGYQQQDQQGYDQQAYRQMPGYQPQPMYGPQPRSKLAAGLLGIFLGSLGVHNFYLGFTGKAVAQLLLTLIGWVLFGLGPVIAGIWGLIEGILILCSTYGSNWHRDAKGIELSD